MKSPIKVFADKLPVGRKLDEFMWYDEFGAALRKGNARIDILK
jgi:hypothetical protein